MTFQHILAAVDFSDVSRRALRTAADLAGRSGARLSVLHSEAPSVPREDVSELLAEFIADAGLPEGVEPQSVLTSGDAAFDVTQWRATPPRSGGVARNQESRGLVARGAAAGHEE